ncbi:MAG: hypothetical protein Tsb0015_03580 [Simkaniaceae bacterium]
MDRYLHKYYKQHHSLGSKDRKFLTELIYHLFKWKGFYDFFLEKPVTWEKRWQLYKKGGLSNQKHSLQLPPHIKVSFPSWLFKKISKQYGVVKAEEICYILNEQAPTTVRINPLCISREQLLDNWLSKGYNVEPTSFSPLGITFLKKEPLFSFSEFKKGYFEVQDEGSQIIAELIEVRAGGHILDFCAGSGGKTLAFAPLMEKKGQIYLHDIRLSALQEAKKRLKRAGVQNFQILPPHTMPCKKLFKKMDYVVLDVPCSGTGTFRRNPDLKWRLTEDAFKFYIEEQRKIFENGLAYLKDSGKIVYITCSILKEENEEQMQFFLKHFPVQIEKTLTLLPRSQGNDGFFGAVLRKTN